MSCIVAPADLSFSEMMRKQERAVKRAIRDLNKERTALERNEKKMQIDLKKMAQKGQMVLPLLLIRCLRSSLVLVLCLELLLLVLLVLLVNGTVFKC